MTNSNKKILQFLLVNISVILLFTIAASMDSIRFVDGRELSRNGEIITSSGGLIPEEDISLLARIIGVMLVISFVVSVVMFFISKEARKRFIRWMILAAIITLIVSFPRPGPGSQGISPPDQTQASLLDITPLAGSSTSGGEEIAIAEQIKEPPNWVVTILSFFVSIILIGIIAAFILKKKPPKPLDKVVEEVQKAIDAIEIGANFKDVIIRCYHEMSQALAQEQDLTRGQEMTPREFKRILIERGFPKNEVGKLTTLFEKVRYGSKQASKDDEIIAIDSLKAIINNIP